MLNFFKKTNLRKNKVYRVVTHFPSGNYDTGSGFFIDVDKFLTCFHVAFGDELRVIKNRVNFQNYSGTNDHEKLKNYFNDRISKIEIVLPDKSKLLAKLNRFDERYDVAVLDVNPAGKKVEICTLDTQTKLKHGDYVYFGGFPAHHDYLAGTSPFAAHEGMVSSFVETMIGGNKYQHIQINSINLGGNSGAPLFKRNGEKVIGIINGNMNWGNDNVMFGDAETNKASIASLRIPLSIAYATSLKFIKENTDIFKTREQAKLN
jgi:S1-C subfamily serine protease